MVTRRARARGGASAAAPSTLAVYGDAAYGAAAFSGTPAFIQSVNSDPDVGMVVHVGDIHSGSQPCTEAYDQSVYDMWTGPDGYDDPLVYTRGRARSSPRDAPSA